MKTAYTRTNEWDSNILDLIDKKPSLIKLKDWAIPWSRQLTIDDIQKREGKEK